MARTPKKIVYRATLSDETVAKLEAMTKRFKALTKPLDDMTSKFRQMNYALKPITKKLEGIGKSMKSLGKIGLASVTAPLSALATKSALAFGDVESELEKLKVVANLDPQGLSNLKQIAIDIGASTQFSTKDALEGLKYLAMNGTTGAKNLAQIITPTMDLTGAAKLKSDISLSEVAQLMSGTMNAFGIDSSKSQNVSDKMALAMRDSAMTMEDLGGAMQKAASLSKTAGLSFEELTGSLMQLSKVNVKGEIAGTALAGFFSRVLKPTKEMTDVFSKYNINTNKFIEKGKLKDFVGLLEELQKKNVTSGDIMSIMGQEAGKYLVGLIEKTRELRENIASVQFDFHGVAKELNASNMKGFSGALEKVASNFETLTLKIGDSGLGSFATGVLTILDEILEALNKLTPESFGSVMMWSAIAALAPIGLIAAGTFAPSLPILAGLVTLFKGLGGIAKTLTYLTATGAFAGLGALLSYALQDNEPVTDPEFDSFMNRKFSTEASRFTQKKQTQFPQSTDSKITIDFKNIPRGVDIQAPKTPGNLDLWLQYDYGIK